MEPATTIPLEDGLAYPAETVGGKASNLSRLIRAGFKVPRGICIPAHVYRKFVDTTKVGAFIFYELGRKDLDGMRWEEMWDAALRIRNVFLKTELPAGIRDAIAAEIKSRFKGRPLAVRSSSIFEDSAIHSYAGLHESFLNVRGEDETIRHVKLVWASLWSDAAIAYSRELRLDAGSSAMAVVIQEMLPGSVSGVAFGVSPIDEQTAVIEAVTGLNKGLVDGDVEPDRWIIERSTGRVVSYTPAREKKATVASAGGTRIVAVDGPDAPRLSPEQTEAVFRTLLDVEKAMGYVPDMEWTISGGEIFVLQARPVSRVKFEDADRRRGWDMTLRRSFDNLKKLSAGITGELIPAMIRDAEMMESVRIADLDDEGLEKEQEARQKIFDKWRRVYWDEFIPLAHGARLFGQVYNDKVRPDDPYEFVDLLSSGAIVSVERNRRLEDLAAKLRDDPGLAGENLEITNEVFKEEIRRFTEAFPGMDNIAALLKKMASGDPAARKKPTSDKKALEKKFLDTFSEDELPEARELMDLARLSYKLRDDDNVYLGRIEGQLARVAAERRRRLGEACRDERSCRAAEDAIADIALPHPAPVPRSGTAGDTESSGTEKGRRRQMRGQPAGKGIARGKARVIFERADLMAVEKGEILVCDSIDPEMTFVIPMVSGIVERRGGMLIHGAIIAREYGLPCVTGIEGATVHIRTGDDITVDGYFGLVINHSV
jgi:rifampicin phosphotransferase